MPVDYDESYTQYQSGRSAVRKLARRLYLRSAASLVSGPTLDFGCGIGELLERLPAGSMGLEYNQTTVEYCRRRGLDVHWYDGTADGWGLSAVQRGRRFESLVVSHVLEHFDDPVQLLAMLLPSAAALGITKALLIVPGQAGFRIDPTHRKFVDLNMLASVISSFPGQWRIKVAKYFPFDLRVIGEVFPHHELQVLCERNEPSIASRSRTL
jgi:hypothetical protein